MADSIVKSGGRRHAQGGLYVCDSLNYKIRHITADGAISTVPIQTAGADLTVDPKGNLYVAAGDHVLRLSPNGQLTTFAGANCEGEGATAPVGGGQLAVDICLFNAQAVVADSQGNIYIYDSGRILVVDTSGRVSTFADYSAVVYTHLAIDDAGTLFVSGSDTVFFTGYRPVAPRV